MDVNKESNMLKIYGYRVKELYEELKSKKESLYYKEIDKEEFDKEESKLRNTRLEPITGLTGKKIDVYIDRMKKRYQLNYYLNFMFIIEMVINSFSSIINSKEFSSENNSINYVFLKFV